VKGGKSDSKWEVFATRRIKIWHARADTPVVGGGGCWGVVLKSGRGGRRTKVSNKVPGLVVQIKKGA